MAALVPSLTQRGYGGYKPLAPVTRQHFGLIAPTDGHTGPWNCPGCEYEMESERERERQGDRGIEGERDEGKW